MLYHVLLHKNNGLHLLFLAFTLAASVMYASELSLRIWKKIDFSPTLADPLLVTLSQSQQLFVLIYSMKNASKVLALSHLLFLTLSEKRKLDILCVELFTAVRMKSRDCVVLVDQSKHWHVRRQARVEEDAEILWRSFLLSSATAKQ
eukprot:g43666.t1